MIMMTGPQTIAIVFTAEAGVFSKIVETKPITPFQSGISPPGSTILLV